ncbi:MAG: hypothetical protein JWO60_2372 [Frankiales bacterium]|nr:hypothetical protein [Frankiales bacterium]
MRTSKTLTSLALAGALALSVSACGSNDADTGAQAAPSADSSKPVAQIDNLTGKMTQVTLDAGFVEGLTSLKLTPAPVGTAKIEGGVATFPITGGSATYYTPGTVDPYVQGMINHDGSGLSLTDGKTKVELTNFDVDPAKSVLTGDVSANGTSVVQDAPLFFLDGSTLQPLKMEGPDAVLEGTTVSLTKEAADLLNKTYKVTALTEYFKVGVAKITLAVPAS